MKKLLTILTLMCFNITLFSQSHNESPVFIDFGPKAMIGIATINPTLISDSSSGFEHSFASYGYSFGGKFAIDFGEHFAVVGEYLINQNKQSFITSTKNQYIHYNRHEIPILLRYNGNNLGFVEAGISLYKTKSVNETDLKGVKTSYTSLYNNNGKSAILGFGGTITTLGEINIQMGLRLKYDLDDYVNGGNTKTSANSVYALNSGITSTKPLSAMIFLELNYDLGFTRSRSNCGGSRKIKIGNR